ncbi:hypothetical protein ES703_105006 [subsurface metagenome]
MALFCSNTRSLKTGNTSTGDYYFSPFLCFRKAVVAPFTLAFMSTGGTNRAGDRSITEKPGQADLTRDTGSDVLLPVPHNLVGQSWIRDHGSTHLPNIQLAIRDSLLRNLRNEKPVGHADRYFNRLFCPLSDIEPFTHRDIPGDNRAHGLLPADGHA